MHSRLSRHQIVGALRWIKSKWPANIFPFTSWLLSPMIAALAMNLSSASVVSYAMRLRAAGAAGA